MIEFITEKVLAFKSSCPLCGKEIILESQNFSTNQMNNHIQNEHFTNKDVIRFKFVTGRTQEEMDLQIERKKVIFLLEVVQKYREKTGEIGNK